MKDYEIKEEYKTKQNNPEEDKYIKKYRENNLRSIRRVREDYYKVELKKFVLQLQLLLFNFRLRTRICVFVFFK